MKKVISAIVALMLLMCSIAVAEGGESYPVGPYSFAADGSYSVSVNNENDIVVSTPDGQYYANLMYQLFSDFGLTPELFDQAGITSLHQVGDMVVDSVFSSTNGLLVENGRESGYIGELHTIYYHGTMTSDQTPVYGVLIVTEEGALSILTKSMSAECTLEGSRSIADSLVGCLSLNGAPISDASPAAADGLTSIGGSLSGLDSLQNGNSDDAAADTPETSEVAVVGSYSLATPEGWSLYYSSDLQAVYNCGDAMITVGVTSVGSESLFASFDDEAFASMLETGTETGLNIAGFDTETLTFEQMTAADGSLYIRFSGDASAVMGESMHVTGASLITGGDMALIMAFHPADTADDINAILEQGLAMFFN